MTIIHASKKQLLENTITLQPHQLDVTIGLEIKRNKALDYLSKLDVLSQMEIFETLSMRNLRDLLEVA